jgi:phosphoglycerate dehydrogenase-like enzyme
MRGLARSEEQVMDKVVLTEHLDEAAAGWLAAQVTLVRQSHEDPAALRRELADAAGLVVRTYTQVTEDLLADAPQLRVVGRAGVGLDNIDLDACRRRGVRVVHTPDANTQAVVEYAWALILDALRPRMYLKGQVTAATFHDMRRACLADHQLGELTLGVLGMGRIGRRVARVGAVLGMRVLAHDLIPPTELGLTDGCPAQFVDAAALWREADILTIHIDGRPSNRHFINADVLGRLKATCTLINTARGIVVDSAALAAWARQTAAHGGRAVLDVHDPEPPPPDYPLWGLSNVRLLPHLASRTATAMANMSWVVRDVANVLRGQRPRWPAP